MAYSVFGQITSLNGEAEEGMTVVAAGTGNCSIYSEESALEPNGNFRVRGLQPYCSYTVRVERNAESKVPIERVLPPFIDVTVRFYPAGFCSFSQFLFISRTSTGIWLDSAS